MFKVTTAVTTEPVTTSQAKAHLNVIGSTDDTLIAALISAAREFGEHYTGRALAPQTIEMALDTFPDWDGPILLDRPPVATISSVKYTDTAGVEQTIAAASYALSLYGDSRKLSCTYGITWPLTREIPDAVRIRYVTGYTTLPTAGKNAMLLLIGHLYENREGVSPIKADEVPMGIRSLFDTIKIWAK